MKILEWILHKKYEWTIYLNIFKFLQILVSLGFRYLFAWMRALLSRFSGAIDWNSLEKYQSNIQKIVKSHKTTYNLSPELRRPAMLRSRSEGTKLAWMAITWPYWRQALSTLSSTNPKLSHEPKLSQQPPGHLPPPSLRSPHTIIQYSPPKL